MKNSREEKGLNLLIKTVMGPNKIYIHRRDVSFSETKEDPTDIEFINKDELLSRIDDVIASTNKDGIASGIARLALNHVKNIINKMEND